MQPSRRAVVMGVLLFAWSLTAAAAAAAPSVVNLDADSPYYPKRTYPKLITPEWVGEAGVDAVVILAIDDMRDHRRYETVLRPILERLKQIDGRAPVSIMTCKIDPATPQLQAWLKEGLSFEVHTVDHPCPLLAGNDFAKAKSTYDRCVDQIFSIPNNRPVAFRTPCCDSLDTPSPRLFAEIFNRASPGGHFLSIDSSVFNITTPSDPDLARDVVFDEIGRERFRKYVPFESFVNTIEDYPYPYIIGRLCWEFPCATPSDWQAQALHKPANPQTTADWKALLDATVVKRGVMTMVFHPYGWSTPEQFVELIDHATKTYGKRVKFLTFREAEERLTKNLGDGVALRDTNGADSGVRLVDLNGDGYLDVLFTGSHRARVWNVREGNWSDAPYPANWAEAEKLVAGGATVYLKDLDGDGKSELVAGEKVYRWDGASWKAAAYQLPAGTAIGAGGAFVDLDEDGYADFVFSDATRSSVYLFDPPDKGWTRVVFDTKRGEAGKPELPPIVRADGTDNGMWVHSRTLWWQNENTDKLPNLVDRRTFNELLKDVEPRAKSPAAGLASIRVAPGFKVELVASEPLVQDPVAFSFGPDGKLWVVEMPDYPLGIDGKGTVGGRVKYLEDTDGDGVYDKVTLFLEKVPYPTSVLPWKKGVLVAAAPDIFYAEDTDGDGKADRREVLFTGFKEGNQQHRLNHLSFGLDNWVYGANGDSGGNVKSVKTGKTVSISGRDFRFRPDTGEFEAVAGQSQFGRSRTDAGDWFGCNNSNPLWHFPMDEAFLKRNPHVPVPPDVMRVDVPRVAGAAPVFPISITRARFNDFNTANHFTSACSAQVYRDDLFGMVPSGGSGSLQVFISEPVHNLVHREIVTATGATFVSERAAGEQANEFLSSSDNWFRPTTVDTGPDGALYVADMYRAVIEHPQWIPKDWQARLDLRAGHDKGRIYRVAPVGERRRAIPRLDRLETAALVAALDSASGWQRDMAQWLLVWRNDPAAVPALEALVAKSSHTMGRMQALCTLDGMGALKPAVAARAMGDADPAVRRHAVRLAAGEVKASAELQAAIKSLKDEPDPQVRMQLAYTLGQWDDPAGAVELGTLAVASAADRFTLAAALSSLNGTNVRAVAGAVTAAAAEGRTPPAALLAGVFRTALGTGNAPAIAETVKTLTTPRDGVFAAWQFQTLANALDSLATAGTSLTQLAKSEPSMAASVTAAKGVIEAAAKTVTDEAAPLEKRAAGVALLGRDRDRQAQDNTILERLLAPQSPRELQSAAIATLVGRRGTGNYERLLAHWKGMTPELRSNVLDGLLSRSDSANQLLDAIDARRVLAIEIDAPRRQRLLQFPDRGLRGRAATVFAGAVNPDRQKVIDAFGEALTLKGDAKSGQALFAKTCATCHRIGDVGNAVGPDLASVGDKSPQGLLTAILDPNRAVEPRYINYIATTGDDQTLTGLLSAESATSITLLGPDAKPQTLRRQDLKDLRSSNTSLMPEGLEAGLKAQDLADLIAYVRAGK